MVLEATGKEVLPSERPQLQKRLLGVRLIRAREHAMSVKRWNGALKATTDLIQARSISGAPTEQEFDKYRELVSLAGYGRGVIPPL